MELSEVKETIDLITGNIEQRIVGKTFEIKLVLSAMLAGGHVLLEDVPGQARQYWRSLWLSHLTLSFREYSLLLICCLRR